MVRIRLRRTGKKGQHSFRVVIADLESPRNGRFIENIGVYDPMVDPPTIKIDAERALYWLSQGAQPSESTLRLLRKQGIVERFEALKSSQKAGGAADAEPEAAPQP